MSEHTKLPWKITDGNRNGDVYIGSNEEHHFIIVEGGFFVPNAQSNAEFIVRACNSHEKLLAACEGTLRIKQLWFVQSDKPEHKGESEALSIMLDTIEVAIKQANKEN